MSEHGLQHLCVSLFVVCIYSCTRPANCAGSTGKDGKTGQLCSKENVGILSRHRRQEAGVIRPDLAVEVFIVVDYAAYFLWANTTSELVSHRIWSSKPNVTERLVEWYTLHMQGVNERFQRTEGSFKLNIELIGVFVATTEDKQPWIRYNTTQPLINYNISSDSHINRTITWTESAEAFIGWTTAQYHSKPADHYIWLTGLGLTLDDTENNCTDDGSVMSPGVYPRIQDGNRLWQFSSCSQNEILRILENSNKSCLLQDSRSAMTLPTQYTLPGVEISADHQCGLVFGPNFTVCREQHGTHYADICYGLWCCNSTGVVHTMIPMEGTPCNIHMRCIIGECIDDPTGYPTDSYPNSCLFGHLHIVSGITCWMAVKYNRSMCYDAKFQSNCCRSCSKAEAFAVLGCPFGDRGQYHNCDEIDNWDCYDKPIRDDCCETCATFRLSPPIPVLGCAYGDKRAGCDAIFPGECYGNQTRDDCCQYCHDNKTGKQGCEYGDKTEVCDQGPVNGCYQLQFRDDCCQYCDENNTGRNECPYGDRIEDCVEGSCYTYSQYKRKNQCCKTCGPSPTPGPPQSTPLTTESTAFTTRIEMTTESTSLVSSTTSASNGGNTTVLVVGVSVGAVCLVLVLIIAFICWRKRRNSEPKHLSPITDVMYNEYKLSKRAPVPEPRDIERPKSGSKQKLMQQDSEVYAYINPDEVESIPSKTGSATNPQNGVKRQSRNEDDPLPPTPGDYLELKVVDNYGYMEPVEKHKTKSTPYSEPYSDNQTTLYPYKTGDPPYKSQ